MTATLASFLLFQIATTTADSAIVNPNGRVPPSIRAVRVSDPPRVDGTLDEEVWSGTTVASGFRRDEPSDGRPAAERTEVRLVYTDSDLYVGARMYHRDPATVSALRGRRDAGVFNDQFFVAIDSYHDHRTAFVFGVTPGGGRTDIASGGDSRRRGMDLSWDPVWEANTRIDSAGWTAEIRIPFSQLRFSPEVAVWGIQFRRDILHSGEAVDWSWAPQSEPGFASKFGHLMGLQDVPRPGRLEVLPYTVASSRFTQGADPGNPFDDGDVHHGNVGLDLKYGIASWLTLDAAINPDFGQVEADPAVVNLSAFETFFEERRPFFVEGSDIFTFGSGGSSGLQHFYSRRIGGRPSVSPDGAATYVDAPDAATILGAAKLSGRTESGWSLGLLNATTQREVARTAGPEGVEGAVVPVEPRTNVSVLRVRKDFREGRTQIGMIGTSVQRRLDDPAFDVLRDQAYGGGVDFSIRFDQNRHALTGSLSGSHIRGPAPAIGLAQQASVRYFQRPDQDRLTYDPEATSMSGVAGTVQLQKEGGDWLYGVATTYVSPGFELNDAGFLTRSDNIFVGAGGGRSWREPTSWFRSLNVRSRVLNQWNGGFEPISRTAMVEADLQTLGLQRASVGFTYDFEVQDDRETRGGPAVVRPARWQARLGLNSDNRKPVSAGLALAYRGDTKAGNELSIGPSFSGRGEGWVSWSLRPTYRSSRTDAFYVTQGEDAEAVSTFGRRYVFGELRQRSLDLTMRLDMAVTPRLTVQLWAQPFVATGDYDHFSFFRQPGTYDFGEYGAGASTLTHEAETDAITVDADGPGGPAPGLEFANPDFKWRSLRGNLVLRWEYMTGSTLFLVWSQDRSGIGDDTDFDGFADLRRVFHDRQRNVFLVKIDYWFTS